MYRCARGRFETGTGENDVGLGLIILAFVCAGAVAVLLILLTKGWKRGRQSSAEAPPTSSRQMAPMPAASTALEAAPARPTQIIVADGDEQMLALTSLDLTTATQRLKGAERVDAGMFGRALEPIMQVVPSMATAGMAANRQLMEVVINGPLVAARDGNGFRAITMGADGIQQNARLFKPEALQNVANAAMVWQLASVIVAQKHLADISAALKRLEKTVAGVQSFLEEERAALIQAAMNYIKNARQAMQQGEFLERTRDKLEDFEIQLEQAGIALLRQIQRESALALERDTVGCEGEYQSALRKHQGIADRVKELVACTDVRIANWYLCSLYPDRSRMLAGRMEQIQAFVTEVRTLQEHLESVVDSDCKMIDATWTSDETIAARRADVRRGATGTTDLNEGASRCEQIMARVEGVSADLATPTRLLVEVEKGAAKAIYLSHEKPTIPPLRIRQPVALASS